MYPARFALARPTSLDEAIRLLQEGNGDARLLAGGHSLLPLMKLRLAQPGTLIDIGRLPDLRYIREDGDQVAVGALTTYHELETSGLLQERVPIVPEAASHVGDVQVRNRGTIGGSLAHADPAADLPAVLLALDGQIVAQGPAGRRTIPASAFFVDVLTTALKPDEVLVEVRLPARRAGEGAAYRKFEQPASGYALVGVAAVARVDGTTIAEARVGMTGVSARPYRATAVEQALVGQSAQGIALEDAATRASEGVEVASDLHAAADYRAHLAGVMARRALEAALARAFNP